MSKSPAVGRLLRSAVLARRRHLLVAFAVNVLAAAYVVAALSYTSGLSVALNEIEMVRFGEDFDWLVTASLEQAAVGQVPPLPVDLVDELRSLPSATEVRPVTEQVIELNGQRVLGLSWDELDWLPFRLASGEPPGPNDIVLTTYFAELNGLDIGDEIQAVGLEARRLTVSGTLDFDGLLSTEALPMSYALVEDTTATSLVGGPDRPTKLLIAVDEPLPSSPESSFLTFAVIDAKLRAADTSHIAVAANGDGSFVYRGLDDLRNAVITTLRGFAALGVVAAWLLVRNVYLLAYARHVRELALLRALGATRTGIAAVEAGLALPPSVAGAIVGAGLGGPLASQMASFSGGSRFLVPFEPTVSLPLVAAMALCVVAVNLGGALIPAIRASRLSPIEGLGDEPEHHSAADARRSLRRWRVSWPRLAMLATLGLLIAIAAPPWLQTAAALACFTAIGLMIAPLALRALPSGRRGVVVAATVVPSFLAIAAYAALRSTGEGTRWALEVFLVVCVAVPFASAFATPGHVVKVGLRSAKLRASRTAITAALAVLLVSACTIVYGSVRDSLAAQQASAFVAPLKVDGPIDEETQAFIRDLPEVDSIRSFSLTQPVGILVAGEQLNLSDENLSRSQERLFNSLGAQQGWALFEAAELLGGQDVLPATGFVVDLTEIERHLVVDFGNMPAHERPSLLLEAGTRDAYSLDIEKDLALVLATGSAIPISEIIEYDDDGFGTSRLLVDEGRLPPQLGPADMLTIVPGEGVDPTELRQSINQRLAARGSPAIVVASGEVIGAEGRVLRQLTRALRVLQLATLAFAVLSLAVSLYFEAANRVRETGLLRASGASGSDIRLIFLWEAMVAVAVGAAIGVVLGIGTGAALVAALPAALQVGLSVPWGEVALYLVAWGSLSPLAVLAAGHRAASTPLFVALAD